MYKLCVYSRSARVWRQESTPGECFLKWLGVEVWEVNFRSFFEQKEGGMQGRRRRATRGRAFSCTVSTWNRRPSEWQAAELNVPMARWHTYALTHICTSTYKRTHTHTCTPPPHQHCWFATLGLCWWLANVTFRLTATCLVTSGQSAPSSLTPLPHVPFPTDFSLTSLRSVSSARTAAKGVAWIVFFFASGTTTVATGCLPLKGGFKEEVKKHTGY